MSKPVLGLMLAASLALACQGQPESTEQTLPEAFFASGPQLVRIPVSSSAGADSLRARGLEVVVVERDFVVARVGAAQARQVQELALQMQPVTEDDLIQRLIRVVTGEQPDLNELAGSGIDIWEVKEDTVLAQAFDKHILQLRAQGFTVEIVEDNVLNLVKEQSQE